MLNEQGFDLWADGYDRSVGLSEEDGSYPFAGYRAVLGHIAARVMEKPRASVLDIGFGTGVLTARLYQAGCRVYGPDFSARRIALARETMPDAQLVQGDFTQGIVPELTANRYDFIISTYALHHLTDEQKPGFIRSLLKLLTPGGTLLVGDVAFATRTEEASCRAAAGDDWDDEEYYFVAEDMPGYAPDSFTPLSHCAGVLAWCRPVVTLAPLSPANEPALLALDCSGFPPAYVEPPARTIALTHWGEENGMDGFCFAIQADGHDAGLMLLGQAIPDPADPAEVRGKRYFRLLGFVLGREHRGRGVGSEALRQALSALYDTYGPVPVVLECHKENPALRLYRQLGFRTIGEHGTDWVMLLPSPAKEPAHASD